jgi:phosphoribosylformimino-5-aminoimidazole carboxamide ribotide isomerase
MIETIPAIDIKDGRCVRLRQGEMDQVTVYAERPADAAKQWAGFGPRRIHIVDLDGAVQGKPANLPAIEEIVRNVAVKVQIGGGIRNMDTIRAYLDRGVERVILGTIALEDPAFVEEACKAYPGQIVVGIDARDGKVAVRGWAETSDTTAVALAQRLSSAGVAAIVYTDISRDGMMSGPNFEATAEMAQASPIPIIASGGISRIEDLAQLSRIENVVAAIVGKALYTGAIDLKAALALG